MTFFLIECLPRVRYCSKYFVYICKQTNIPSNQVELMLSYRVTTHFALVLRMNSSFIHSVLRNRLYWGKGRLNRLGSEQKKTKVHHSLIIQTKVCWGLGSLLDCWMGMMYFYSTGEPQTHIGLLIRSHVRSALIMWGKSDHFVPGILDFDAS